MSVGSREVAIFVIDCSVSMGREIEFDQGLGDRSETTMTTPLKVMLKYVKAKIAQRIMRDLKTTPLAILTYGVSKTKNVLTARQRETLGDDYDPTEDAYRHYFEEVPMSFTPERGMLEHLDGVQAGKGPDGKGKQWDADIHTAIILAIETLENEPKVRNYKKKEIYLLTDGESNTDWDNIEGTVKRLNEKDIGLTVIGMNFDDPEMDFVETGKSARKAANEVQLNALVDALTTESVVATASRALEALAEPNVRAVAPQATRTHLSIGDCSDNTCSSLKIFVDVKKAVSVAPVKSQKQLSIKGYPRAFGGGGGGGGGAFGDSQMGGGESQSAFTGGGRGTETKSRVGKSLETVLAEAGLRPPDLDEGEIDTAVREAQRETRFYYRPKEETLEERVAREAREAEDRKGVKQDQQEEDDEEVRDTGNAELTEAYYYGGSLVPTGDMTEGAGTLIGNETGMQVVGFQKMDSLRYDWRLNDPLYVHAARGETSSELWLSSFIHALNERNSVAIVRYVAKGMNRNSVFKLPDPKMGVLYPMIEPGIAEYCYWIQLPLAEDIRYVSFTSYERLWNRKGERIYEHKLLPTKEQDEAMDEFVDRMSLVLPDDEEGNPVSWFDVADSYSPAIHNVENALVFRLSDFDADLPAPPSALAKYMDPPVDVVIASEDARKAAIAAFDVKLVPPKPKKVSKKVDNFATEQSGIDFERLFGSSARNAKGPASTFSAPVPTPRNNIDHAMDVDPNPFTSNSTGTKKQPAPVKSTPPSAPAVVEKFSMDVDGDDEPVAPAGNDDEQEEPEDPPTEDEDDDVGATSPSSPTGPVLSKISTTDPATDFKKVLKARGVEVAIPLMVDAAGSLVKTSFSTAKYDGAVRALGLARSAASEQQQPALYNDALRRLVNTLVVDPKKKDFLPHVSRGEVGLLVGGETSEQDVQTFSSLLTG